MPADPRLPPEDQDAKPSIPLAAQPNASSAGGSDLEDLWTPDAPTPPAVKKTETPRNRGRLGKTLAVAAGVAAAAFGIWRWTARIDPQALVTALAARHLDALRARDYAGAYAALSDAAKKNCAEDEFSSAASRGGEEWTWSGLSVERREPDAILLTYELRVSDRQPRQERLLFTLENGRWTRPYNRALTTRAEAALAAGDVEKGLDLAHAAASINPRDPTAWGLLCAAAHARKEYQDAETRCLKSIELARSYPSDIPPASLYRLHAILADAYGRAPARPNKAVEQYGAMLSFQDIPREDQCRTLLARAQAYAGMSRPGEALADIKKASPLCSKPQDIRFIETLRRDIRAPDDQ